MVASTDFWGRRTFAYEINHKTEGSYVVYEILAEPGALDGVERSLRLADEIVRHKLLRLPDAEAERRGLMGRSEEHTSELQSLMRSSYAVFCLKKKTLAQRLQTSKKTQSS